jgi:DNA-directed RNA polymerase subunit RPC12/RpoP
MTAGLYPFRCIDCNQRIWASVWMLSKMQFAKCPKCLGLQLTNWDRKHYHQTFWRNFLMTFGAHRYRCARCRYNFLSFRPSMNFEIGPIRGANEAAASESRPL